MKVEQCEWAGSVAALAGPKMPNLPARPHSHIAPANQTPDISEMGLTQNAHPPTSPPATTPNPISDLDLIGAGRSDMSAASTRRAIFEATLENLTAVLATNLFGVIQWDEFGRTEVILKNGVRSALERADITRLMVRCEALGLKRISRQSFAEALHMVARDNPVDSAKEWLESLPEWDRVSRIDRFLPEYLQTVDRPYEQAVGRYWWTSMVARILFPGCKADMVPVVVGAQGIGKSTVLKTIAPIHEFYGEARISDQSKLLAHKIQGKTLVVWEELRGIKGKCDADEVKTFITNSYYEVIDRNRMERCDRRFILAGTSNSKEILRDPEGNRRFLPFEARQQIDISRVESQHAQLWAEALHVVKERAARGLSPVDFQDAERLARDEHVSYVKEARWAGEGKLLAWLDRPQSNFSTEDALAAIGFWTNQISMREKRDMANTLRQLGCRQRSTRVPGMTNPQKRWYRA